MKKETFATQLDCAIRARIYEPLVMEIYQQFKSLGIFDAQVQILSLLPNKMMPPVAHTLATHVNREKAIFVHAIGKQTQVEPERLRVLSASIELLWILSLMIDDILDKDRKRGSLQTSWVKFGLEETFVSANQCKTAIAQSLIEHFGSGTLEVFEFYIKKGLVSTQRHRQMDLSATHNQILLDHIDRCDFLSGLPTTIIFGHQDKIGSPAYKNALLGLQLLNQTSQLLNDLKDLDQRDIYQRGPSDIRNGLVTLPIKLLFESMNREEQSQFEQVFGQSNLSGEDKLFLAGVLVKYPVWELIKRRVLDGYTRALNLLSTVVAEEDFSWFNRWVEYKLCRVCT